MNEPRLLDEDWDALPALQWQLGGELVRPPRPSRPLKSKGGRRHG